jgi:hypothetical protein
MWLWELSPWLESRELQATMTVKRNGDGRDVQ